MIHPVCLQLRLFIPSTPTPKTMKNLDIAMAMVTVLFYLTKPMLTLPYLQPHIWYEPPWTFLDINIIDSSIGKLQARRLNNKAKSKQAHPILILYGTNWRWWSNELLGIDTTYTGKSKETKSTEIYWRFLLWYRIYFCFKAL